VLLKLDPDPLLEELAARRSTSNTRTGRSSMQLQSSQSQVAAIAWMKAGET